MAPETLIGRPADIALSHELTYLVICFLVPRIRSERVLRLSELLLLLWIRQRRRSILQAYVADTSCRANVWRFSSVIPGAATGSHAPMAFRA